MKDNQVIQPVEKFRLEQLFCFVDHQSFNDIILIAGFGFGESDTFVGLGNGFRSDI